MRAWFVFDGQNKQAIQEHFTGEGELRELPTQQGRSIYYGQADTSSLNLDQLIGEGVTTLAIVPGGDAQVAENVGKALAQV